MQLPSAKSIPVAVIILFYLCMPAAGQPTVETSRSKRTIHFCPLLPRCRCIGQLVLCAGEQVRNLPDYSGGHFREFNFSDTYISYINCNHFPVHTRWLDVTNAYYLSRSELCRAKKHCVFGDRILSLSMNCRMNPTTVSTTAVSGSTPASEKSQADDDTATALFAVGIVLLLVCAIAYRLLYKRVKKGGVPVVLPEIVVPPPVPVVVEMPSGLSQQLLNRVNSDCSETSFHTASLPNEFTAAHTMSPVVMDTYLDQLEMIESIDVPLVSADVVWEDDLSGELEDDLSGELEVSLQDCVSMVPGSDQPFD